MEDLFETEPFCSDLKASPVPPDLLAILEKGHKDPSSITVLTDEAASRYRKLVGRLAWWAQSRPDHARVLSLLSIGQAAPTNIHENILRKYLRFVRSVAHLYQEYPANSTSIPFYDGITGLGKFRCRATEIDQQRCDLLEGECNQGIQPYATLHNTFVM